MPNKLRVTLESSDNQYLPYPCNGMLELFELGTDGSVITAVFRREGPSEYTGYPFAPVVVRKPVFIYPVVNGDGK